MPRRLVAVKVLLAERRERRHAPDVPGRGEPHGPAELAPVDPHGLPGERRRRRPALPRHGVLLGIDRPALPRHAAAARRGALDRGPHRERGRDRAPAGRAAPRHQAVEHPDDGIRPSGALGLRHRRHARTGRDRATRSGSRFRGRPPRCCTTRSPERSPARSGRSGRRSTRCSPVEAHSRSPAARTALRRSWRGSRRRRFRRSGAKTCRRASRRCSHGRCREAPPPVSRVRSSSSATCSPSKRSSGFPRRRSRSSSTTGRSSRRSTATNALA